MDGKKIKIGESVQRADILTLCFELSANASQGLQKWSAKTFNFEVDLQPVRDQLEIHMFHVVLEVAEQYCLQISTRFPTKHGSHSMTGTLQANKYA